MRAPKRLQQASYRLAKEAEHRRALAGGDAKVGLSEGAVVTKVLAVALKVEGCIDWLGPDPLCFGLVLGIAKSTRVPAAILAALPNKPLGPSTRRDNSLG